MKKVYLMLAALAVGATSYAQQRVAQDHGEAIPSRDLAEQSANRGGGPVWCEDFASGLPSTWSNVTAAGPVDWKYTTVGHTGAYPSQTLLSTTAGNGWMIVDSDADNFSGGGSEDAQITSDVIDCSSVTGPIKLEFEQYFRRWQADITTVRLTTDGGSTWTDWVINSAVTQAGTPNPDVVTIDITAAIAGNPSNVQVAFWWQGAWDYGWQIDDICISEILPNDVRLFNSTFAASGGAYYQTPIMQAKPLDFAADISNIGINDATNVILGVTGGYTGAAPAIASIPVGTVTNTVVSGTFTPSATGALNFVFGATMDSTDANLANNTESLNMEITDTVYALDNDTYAGQWYNQEASGQSNAFCIGNVYEIFQDQVATSISIYVGDQTAPGAVLVPQLWEYNTVDSTYNLVAWGNDYDITANDLGAWVTIGLNQGYNCTAASGAYLTTAGHYGGQNFMFIGYGTNPGGGGYTLSSDDCATWANQPRTPMVRLNFGPNAPGFNEFANTNVTLGQNVPNPFTSNSTINYTLNDGASVTFELIDVTGKTVMEVNEGRKAAGAHNFVLDGSSLEAGVYFYSIVTEQGRATKQLVVTK